MARKAEATTTQPQRLRTTVRRISPASLVSLLIPRGPEADGRERYAPSGQITNFITLRLQTRRGRLSGVELAPDRAVEIFPRVDVDVVAARVVRDRLQRLHRDLHAPRFREARSERNHDRSVLAGG